MSFPAVALDLHLAIRDSQTHSSPISLLIKKLLFIRPFVSMDPCQPKIPKSTIVSPSIHPYQGIHQRFKTPLAKMIKYDIQRWSMNLDNSGYVMQIQIRKFAQRNQGSEFKI